MRPVALSLALLSLVLLFARSWRIDYDYSIDFQVYWLAGNRVAAGQAEDLYLPGGGPAEGTPKEMVGFEFKNLPLVSLAFVPAGGLGYLEAKRLYWWLGLAATLGSGVLIGLGLLPERLGDRTARIAWGLAIVCVAAPTHTALRHGQTTPWVLLAVTASLVAGLRGRDVVAGVCSALGAVVKLPVLILGAADALTSRWRAVGGFAAALALVVLTSLGLFGTTLHARYLEGLGQHAGTVMTGHNNQSIAAVVRRLAAPAALQDWEPRAMPAGVFGVSSAITAGLAVAVLGALYARRTRAQGSTRRLLEFPAAMALGVVALPVAWDHYFMLLLPGLVTLALVMHERGLLRRPLPALALGAAAAGVLLPSPRWLLDHAEAWGLPGAVLVSHYSLGALLVLALAVPLLLWPAGERGGRRA